MDSEPPATRAVAFAAAFSLHGQPPRAPLASAPISHLRRQFHWRRRANAPRWSFMGLDLTNYLPIIIFFAIATALGAGFIIAAWVLAPRKPDKEKVSAYECGFNA